MSRIVLAAVFAGAVLAASASARAAEGPWCALLNFGGARGRRRCKDGAGEDSSPKDA